MSEKTCIVCGVTYPATPEYFHRHPTGHGGLRGRCKACQSAYFARYYADHVDGLRAYSRRYHAEHRHQANAQMRKRYYAKKAESFARRLGRTA